VGGDLFTDSTSLQTGDENDMDDEEVEDKGEKKPTPQPMNPPVPVEKGPSEPMEDVPPISQTGFEQ
jgi:hypothetical protein